MSCWDFHLLKQLENYIYEIYFPFAQTNKLQYEVQFVRIDKNEDTVITLQNNRKRKHELKKEISCKRISISLEEVKNTLQHEMQK